MAARLNWLIFGAGAIGTYIGTNLIMHGQNVVFLEQPEAVKRLLEDGLRFNFRGQEHRILHPDVYSSIPDVLRLAKFDVAIFALKSFDTQSFLELLRPYTSDIPPIFCLQNGVENEAAIERVVGKDKVIAGTVTTAIQRRAVGDIILERQRGIGIAANHPISAQISAVFNDAGLNAHIYPSPSAMKWSKMLTNLLANASCAILDMTPVEVLRNPELYRVEVLQLREALTVMRAMQIKPVNLPSTPVVVFAWIISHLPPHLSQVLIARIASKGRGQKMPSFHIDLHSGKGKSEVDYLNGAVVRFGSKFHLSTPVNRWLNHTMTCLVRGDLELDEYSHKVNNYLLDLNASVRRCKSGY